MWRLYLIKYKYGKLTGVKYGRTQRLRWRDFEIY